jgi:ATP synthase protein I
MREAAPYLGIGTTIAASLGLGLGAGYWLDAKLGTQPGFLLLGSALGMFAGFRQLYELVRTRKK